MKITDLNIDTLEEILELLNFEDFLNAANSNKHIYHAARFLFLRKYCGKKRLLLNFMIEPVNYRFFIREERTVGYLYATVRCLKIALLLLRCFGCLMDRIRFTFSNSTCEKYVTSYIHQYCADSLTKIHIDFIPKNGLHYFMQPFNKVEEVDLLSFEDQIQSPGNDWLCRIFPKMKKLTVPEFSGLFVNGVTVNHFPYLEYLKITRYTGENSRYVRENIISTLKLNPQLKIIDINIKGNASFFDANTIKYAECSLQNLESLILDVESKMFFRNFNNESVHLRNVKYLDARFKPPPHFPFSFDKLETIILKVCYTEYFYNVIAMYPTISTLGLDFGRDTYAPNWERLAKVCPTLRQINCINDDNRNFDIITICNIIEIFKSLKCITFSIMVRNEWSRDLTMQTIEPFFNDDWLISIQLLSVYHKLFFHGTKLHPYCLYYVELKKRIQDAN